MRYNVTGDEYKWKLNTAASRLLFDMGSPAPSSHTYRSSLAIVAIKEDNDSFCTIASDYHPRYQGPTVVRVEAAQLLDPVCI